VRALILNRIFLGGQYYRCRQAFPSGVSQMPAVPTAKHEENHYLSVNTLVRSIEARKYGALDFALFVLNNLVFSSS